MTGVEILMVVSMVMQLMAIVLALLLVNRTRYSVLWICCIICLVMLTIERVFQLDQLNGGVVSDLTFAWIGIIVSVSFSMCVLYARLLVQHVDRMTLMRRLLENRLMTAVLRTEERSRATFSRELHDGLGPLLSSAKMSLSALHRADLSEKDRLTLQNTSAVIDEALRSLREISNNLSPHVLNDFGLARGIKTFIERVASLHSEVTVSFDTKLRTERFDSNIEVILYRVLCELINNSLKHSGCTKIDVTLEKNTNCLLLDYRDNGCGFTPRDVNDSGMGISNIRSRISSLSGTFTLESRPGSGMRAFISVSLESGLAHIPIQDYDQLYGKRNGRRKNKNSTR